MWALSTTKAAHLTVLHEEGLQRLILIIAPVIHPLIKDRFLSSGKDTTGFYVPRNTVA